MNTKTLQASFADEYQNFFRNANLVVSAPLSFIWSGDFSGFYGGITVVQPIPRRIYIGLEPISGESFEANETFLAYDSVHGKFNQYNLHQGLIDSIKEAVGDKLNGQRMHLLSEVMLGTSLGALGAISAIISKLISDTDNCEKIFQNAWKIATKLQQGRSSGSTTYAAIFGGDEPIVFHSQLKKYWAKKISQLAVIKGGLNWPIDFGLIYTGTLVQGQAVIASAEVIKNISSDRQARIKHSLDIDTTPFWEDYMAMLRQVTYETILTMSDMFSSGTNNIPIERFFNTINQYQYLLQFLEITTPDIDRIYSAVHKMANKVDNIVGSGCKISGVGKGGEMLFAVSYGSYREKVVTMIEGLNEKYGTNVVLEYSSWQDGIGAPGLTVEQSLNEGIKYSGLENDSRLIRIYAPKIISSKLISDNDKIVKELDLVLDNVSRKIFVKGEPVSSKQLSSQKATIEILKSLLENDERKLTNTDLPKSYGDNRYDLHGKIAKPLSNIVDLKFEISGETYGDFTIKLMPFNIKIGIIDRL